MSLVKVSPPTSPPPSFYSLSFPGRATLNPSKLDIIEDQSDSPPAFVAASPFEETSSYLHTARSARAPSYSSIEGIKKGKEPLRTEPKDPKEGQSSSSYDDDEPPPPYSEEASPLDSFTYIMSAGAGPSSIITQVSQGGGVGAPLNALGSKCTVCTLHRTVKKIRADVQ